MKIIITVASILLALTSSWASTIIGPVYDIKEDYALNQINKRLKELEKSGELAKLQEEAVTRSKNSIQSPPAKDLPQAKALRKYSYDPTYVVPSDIYDAKGNLMHKSGTRVNPFNWVSFSKNWIFIDGRQSAQVTFAQSLYKKYEGRLKIILVAGRPLDLAKDLNVPVYFDQSAVLTQKLRIGAVPAIVAQKGKVLEITEVPL